MSCQLTEPALASLPTVEIISYQPEYKPYFKSLNLEWIEKYFQAEPADIKILENPEEEVLQKDGQIFFARCNGEIVGTCAILRQSSDTYEGQKLAVTEKAKGKGIGEALVRAALNAAKQKGARFFKGETSSQLTVALSLYKKIGLQVVPPEPGYVSDFARADRHLFMDLSTWEG